MAKRHKRTGNYSGVLATPMQVHRAGARILASETLRAREAEAERKNLEQFVELVVALFKHYGVVLGDFVTLAMKLAQVHVPGFRIREPGERGRGRPSGIDTAEETIKRVEQFREILALAEKLGVKQACEHVSTRKGSRCYGIAPDTLRKMVTDAKRAPARGLNGLAFTLARAAIDLAIVGALFEGDDDESHARASNEVKRRVRRK